MRTFFDDDEDIRGLAAEALAALADEASRETLIRELLGGDTVAVPQVHGSSNASETRQSPNYFSP